MNLDPAAPTSGLNQSGCGIAGGGRRFFSFLNPISDFVARAAQLKERLQVKPEFRGGAEPVTKPQSGVGRHAPLAVDDPCNPVHRHIELAGKFRGGNAEFMGVVR